MRLSFSSAPNPTNLLGPWLQRLRSRLDLPLLLRWQGGSGFKLGEFDQPRVTIDVLDAAGAAALLSPSLDNLGQAYVEGHIDVSGTVQDMVDMAYRLAEAGAQQDAGGHWLGRVVHHLTDAASHTPAADREAIHYHYDVSNAFYAEWLDPAMVYSCAYFENGDETLAQAQTKKIDHILTKLRVQPGQRLLDIGCGWGALVLRAAERFGARCVGITLSQNQFDLATERVRAAGLQGRVEIRLQDYREVHEQFDRISSVGMFEHVGLKNLRAYFQQIHDLLTPDGWALNHGITSSDAQNGETRHGGGRFIDKYVFPHGELPHIGTVLKTMQEGGLEALDAENLRRHYVRTLRCWSEAFEAKSAHLKTLVDDKTWRIWRVYLVGCQWSFEHDDIALFQVLCHRAGQPAQGLPWSRGWMYEGASGVHPH